jgi:AcrR family transcriptional regulator
MGMNQVVTRQKRTQQKSLERREQQKTELRAVILQAAVRLFETGGGYEQFSLRQVAEEVGYSPTTIYLYFKDKDDLLLHVVFEGFREFGQMLQDGYDAGTTPLERLRLVGQAYLEFGLSHPVHYRLMFMQRSEMMFQKLEGYLHTVVDSFEVLQSAVREALEQGILRPHPLEVYTALLWADVHGIVALQISTGQITPDQARAINDVSWSRNLTGMIIPQTP